MGCDDQQLTQMLRERGLRPTKARCLILALLTEHNGHLSTEDILQTLRERGHKVSTATLYQNLNKLANGGLLTRFSGPDGLMRFDANLIPHHHLICVRCGRIVDMKVNDAQLLQLRPVCFQTGEPLSDWQLQGVRLELKGVCPACRTQN
jgi:Fur family peroxide stress response transcriptional regulator